MQDYHIHPGYSIDAANYTPKDYCEKALALNLKEIAFTTHYEAEPERREIDWFLRINGTLVPMEKEDWLKVYFDELLDLREVYKSYGLNVKIGLEVGYFEGIEEKIIKLKENYPFDFIMGSIHTLDHIAISSKKEAPSLFSRLSAEEILEKYFKRLENLIQSGLFEVIGHLDLFLRYGISFYGLKNLLIFNERIRNVFLLIKKRELVIELNSSSLRRGYDFIHPHQFFLKKLISLGIDKFVIGSDAHSLSELGFGQETMLTLLKNFNLKPVSLTNGVVSAREDF
ncbi:histidinol-phosphatase [Carboxydothermus pertinax]|uniref:Histidinol-phosphatase n=1 Tax=Carboxydothermus pertinax TaxID=870242 RepID=A0A1L8CU78_9THEO|nr:histidinol-phosphatase [Carboxydothermus pertinax]GAV22495.1 histidinol phosphate phosphatase [Carboxydothermus pertinax]